MHPTFTGSGRRPRQVNLSGRNTNPFAATPGFGAPGGSALASAEQARIQRQRERDRQNAVSRIQRVWRGHTSRRAAKERLREEYDGTIWTNDPAEWESVTLSQLNRLMLFWNCFETADISRLIRFMSEGLHDSHDKPLTRPLKFALFRLQKLILDGLMRFVKRQRYHDMHVLLSAASTLATRIPAENATLADEYYKTMAAVEEILDSEDLQSLREGLFFNAVALPLRQMNAQTLEVYAAFALEYLSSTKMTENPQLRDWLNRLSGSVNYKLLASALSSTVDVSGWTRYLQLADIDRRLNLLSLFIYFHRQTHDFRNAHAYTSNEDFVSVVSNLLLSVADHPILLEFRRFAHETDRSQSPSPAKEKISFQFYRDQVLSLVNQESISGLLSNTSASFDGSKFKSAADTVASNARRFAAFALALIRIFPKRADEIRMWLYLGSGSIAADDGSRRDLPAIKYFWSATKHTHIFKQISKEPRTAIPLLKSQSTRFESQEQIDQRLADEWRVILIFMELYIFVLKIMDDEEFFSTGYSEPKWSNKSSGPGRDMALALDEVRDLTIFLKNLGFALNFYAKDIEDVIEHNEDELNLGLFFGIGSAQPPASSSKSTGPSSKRPASGISDFSLEHIRGLVTALLRMLYERDSRRNFLKKGHWLMTSKFDMSGFISSVVLEEENRHQIESDDEDDLQFGDDEIHANHLIGTARTQRTIQQERLKRQQRKASKRRYLQAVTPRLEILQNMPFFTPFTTRVQIFREFVTLDKHKRRNGYVDAESWRMAVTHGMFRDETIERHHARIRREHEFEDAYDQFYPLKDGLKEPIQITFVDQFGSVEAGIDGGGVTKEFLTSVTSQAFRNEERPHLFIENDQHLLHPNPVSLEERKAHLRAMGVPEGSSDYRAEISELLQHYEFLGRIIGKCLYEGILIDVNFAGFFLLKWALTGGSGLAPKESGYRANLNDLRELDESLYQGLLQLKNYRGNVEEFSLNFTITDEISVSGKAQAIERELKPGGSDIPVTNQNRLEYISYVARHRLQVQPGPQTNAFLRGLSTIIQPSWLGMFNQAELQTLLGGTSSSIDISDLRRNTLYGGVYVIGDDGLEHPTVELFWKVMQDLSDGERRAVLKFVTSTPNAPLLGFGSLNPRFSIRDSGDDQDRLPSTSTCVNLLKLPRYASEQTMKEKVLYAAFSGAGFDLS
ncbi:hypothetical protein P152DRAFT_507539 [Eremomyces bilateralis CBS 781.70]|uniref:HECT-type E3 ubiquitin transferase n=1 Tax=Eremomyces bilateralis CBS 781.70 TaxID=1392243 RepID=A0A6G1G226_9PEZI|nr:uncharacterized protein P152DRAFT_507539 [Eremomyces bilateralis CBS 781.70]KAF1812165.1 hypothetical protein P152DRAFT_507539 [Eremomyces bilateralis CBS 781.70]